MSAMVAAAAPAHRVRVLRALGLSPWVLRGTVDAASAAPDVPAAACTPNTSAHCVLLLPADAAPRALDLLGRALLTAGTAFARAPRINVRAGRSSAPIPTVPAYLVFGEAQAQALGRELSATVLAAARIVLADEPSAWLTGAGKRRLWTALRQLRRALAETRA